MQKATGLKCLRENIDILQIVNLYQKKNKHMLQFASIIAVCAVELSGAEFYHSLICVFFNFL